MFLLFLKEQRFGTREENRKAWQHITAHTTVLSTPDNVIPMCK